jgi:uncharacterized membrane protein YfcA
VFGLILGGTIILIGVLLIQRELNGLGSLLDLDTESPIGRITLLAIGLVIGISGGFLGIGGPVLVVLVLALIGVPLLTSVAVAQLHLPFVTISTTANYYPTGSIRYSLVLFPMVAYGLGTIFRYHIAQRVDSGHLTLVLGSVLVFSGVYLMI